MLVMEAEYCQIQSPKFQLKCLILTAKTTILCEKVRFCQNTETALKNRIQEENALQQLNHMTNCRSTA